MSTHRFFDKLCCIVLALVLFLTVLSYYAEELGVQASNTGSEYVDRLFDTSIVHSIDIVMEDWHGFIENCEDEEYVLCAVTIDGDLCQNVAIRAKGNTSLTSVASYGNDRYSFKLEFDHYDQSFSYYGLDKLCLNNLIQDNTYLKEYVTYQMMQYMGVASPLCSYAYLTVNGEDWGLYIAVEGIEESFLKRTYGNDYGELYKPDSVNMGGGRGNGQDFQMNEDFFQENTLTEEESDLSGAEPPEQMGRQEMMTGNQDQSIMGSEDVLLCYSDNDPDSYSNIFDNAKTDVTEADQQRLINALKELNQGDAEKAVEVDQVIAYFAVHNFVCNFDSYTGTMIHNYYLYEEDGILSMIPWDYNLAFGGFQSGSDATEMVNMPIDTPVSGGTVESRPMLAWIFDQEAYTEQYHDVLQNLLTEYFDSGLFEEMFQSARTLIAPYVQQDPTKFCTYEEFEAGADTLEQFCLLRAESIQGQLDGTIASTKEEQNLEEQIDASSLSLEAMGTMGNGGAAGQNLGAERQMKDRALEEQDQSQQNSKKVTEDSQGNVETKNSFSQTTDSAEVSEDTVEPQDLNQQETSFSKVAEDNSSDAFSQIETDTAVPAPSDEGEGTDVLPEENSQTPILPGEGDMVPGEAGETPALPEGNTGFDPGEGAFGGEEIIGQGTNETQTLGSSLWLLAGSFAILVFGLFFAIRYRQ